MPNFHTSPSLLHSIGSAGDGRGSSDKVSAIRHRQTTSERIQDLFGENLLSGPQSEGLLSVKKLGNLHARNVKTAEQIEKQRVMAGRSASTLFDQHGLYPTLDVSQRSMEIVRLLTTFDNHRLKQQKATERALASAHASHQGKQDVRLSGGQAGPGVQGEGSQASLEMEGRHSQLQRSGPTAGGHLYLPGGFTLPPLNLQGPPQPLAQQQEHNLAQDGTSSATRSHVAGGGDQAWVLGSSPFSVPAPAAMAAIPSGTHRVPGQQPGTTSAQAPRPLLSSFPSVGSPLGRQRGSSPNPLSPGRAAQQHSSTNTVQGGAGLSPRPLEVVGSPRGTQPLAGRPGSAGEGAPLRPLSSKQLRALGQQDIRRVVNSMDRVLSGALTEGPETSGATSREPGSPPSLVDRVRVAAALSGGGGGSRGGSRPASAVRDMGNTAVQPGSQPSSTLARVSAPIQGPTLSLEAILQGGGGRAAPASAGGTPRSRPGSRGHNPTSEGPGNGVSPRNTGSATASGSLHAAGKLQDAAAVGSPRGDLQHQRSRLGSRGQDKGGVLQGGMTPGAAGGGEPPGAEGLDEWQGLAERPLSAAGAADGLARMVILGLGADGAQPGSAGSGGPGGGEMPWSSRSSTPRAFTYGGRTTMAFSGVYGRRHQLEQHVRDKGRYIMGANPAGYVEDVAAAEVAAYLEAADRGRTVLSYTQVMPADALGQRALRGSVQELHFRRPYFQVPPIPVPKADRELHDLALAAAAAATAEPAAQESSRTTGQEPVPATGQHQGAGGSCGDATGTDAAGSADTAASGPTQTAEAAGQSTSVTAAAEGEQQGGRQDVTTGKPSLSGTPAGWPRTSLAGGEAPAAAGGLVSQPAEQGRAAGQQQQQQQTWAGVSWDPQDGIFSARVMGSDARALNDSSTTKEKQLAMDWRRLVARDSFRRYIAAMDSGYRSGTTDLEMVMSRIQGVLRMYVDLLQSSFIYYASLEVDQGNMGLGMSLTAWRTLMADIHISDMLQKFIQPPQLDAVYLEALTAAETVDLAAPLDQVPEEQLMRHEFMDALIRLATCKYVRTNVAPTVPDGLKLLFVQDLAEWLPPAARHVSADWRDSRLNSSPDVDDALREAAPLLHALFSLLCARSRSRYLHLSDWLEALEGGGLLGAHVGVTPHAAALVFHWSQLVVVDEVQRRSRAQAMDPLDFIEGFARLADLISPPTREELPWQLQHMLGVPEAELPAVMATHPWATYYSMLQMHSLRLGRSLADLPRRHSSGLGGAPPSRPLADKIWAMMEYFRQVMYVRWETQDDERLIARLSAMTGMLVEENSRESAAAGSAL